MASWDLRRLQMSLQKRSPLSVYVFIGEEPFLLDEAIGAVRAVALEGGAADFNYDQFFADDDDVIKVRDTVEMLPMMSPRRMVLFRGVDGLKVKDWEVLQHIIHSPVDTSVFILTASKLDKRTKHYKMLAEKATIVELPRPYENQLPVWIEYVGNKYGLKINSEANSLLRQFVGTSLTEIHNEIKKLRDYIGGATEVMAEHVLQVVSRSRADSVFDLTNAIGRKDRGAALHCLANLLGHGESEVGAVAMIARHLRILSIVRSGTREGTPVTKLCARAGIPQFFLREYQGQAKLWPDDKIERTIHALKDTDRALKSSPVSSHIWLENFIIRTCDY